jgi:hypothetical protein
LKAVLLTFAIAALLPVGARAAARPACEALFAKGLDLDYYRAETAAKRAEARAKFFRWADELAGEVRSVEAAAIPSADLSAAWWRIAFARRNSSSVEKGLLEMGELDAILRARDPGARLRALDSAYRISEFRLRTSLHFDRAAGKIGTALRKARKGISKRTYERLPGSLRERAESILAKTAAVGRRARELPAYFDVSPRVSNANRARTVTLYAALKLRSILIGGIDFLSPVHLRTFLPERWLERTAPIFSKLEKDPKFVPMGEDLEILRRYGAEAAFEKRSALLAKNPKWFRTLRIADRTYRWGVAALGAVAIALAVEQSALGDEPPVDIDAFLADPKNRLLPNQIQLLNETIPFPHLAVRIGDVVYSYGVSHMTSQPIGAYLRSHQPQGDGSGGFFSRQRSVQVVTLDLAPDETAKIQRHFRDQDGRAYDFEAIQSEMNPEYRELRRHLSLQEKKKYENVTLVNDCASMVVRALNLQTSMRVPTAIDPSPSSILMYLGAEKMLGNPRVKSIRLVKGSRDQSPVLQLLRNAYVNAREARLYFHPLSFAVAQGHRTYLEASRGARGLQYFDSDFLSRERERRDSIEEEVRADRDLDYYLKNRETIARDSTHWKKAQEYFQEVYSDQLGRIESGYNELDDILGSLYRLEYYAEAEKELLGSKSFDLQKSLDDPEFFSEIQELLRSVRQDGKEIAE